MSAIWGMINFNNNVVSKEIIEKMQEPFYKYKIDDYQYFTNKNVGMGCAHQFITEESKGEQLPYQEKELFFTADVYLDNREELYEKLEIAEAERKSIPDGALMFEAYKKWGEQFVKHLLGSFACAIYDKREEKVLLVTDYTGNRCLSFSVQNGKVVFSTLLSPIKLAFGQKVQLNQRWLHDFTAISKLAISSECLETPYRNIYQVAPAQIVRINKNGIHRIDYWEPTKIRTKLNLSSDEKYQRAFLDLYEKVVAGSLRSRKETGILLSGGLDSSSVACIAAKQLKKKGKKLQSFTSVPDKDYGGRRNSYLVADETKSVELIAEYTGNIQPHYYDLDGKDAWSDVEHLLDLLEIPYKSVQNVLWIKEILGVAEKTGCKVVLNGQYGNATVSFGDFFMQFYTLLEEHKYCMFVKEFFSFCNINHLSRKQMLKQFLSTLAPKFYRKWKSRKNGMFDEVLAKEELLQKFHTKERFKKAKLNLTEEENFSVKNYRPFIYYKEALTQIGIMETKSSLASGVLLKDPTRDKRIIEFCLSLPSEQFVKEGYQRRLVRVYMKDYVPEQILEDSMRHKGMQSADMIYRLQKRWEKIYPEVEKLLQSEIALEYLDKEKTEELLENIKKPDENRNEGEISGAIYTAILIKYIQKNLICSEKESYKMPDMQNDEKI